MNSRSLRIVFLGTPEFAACSLEKLILGGYNVVAAVTAADKPAGRGKQLQQSAVKVLAEKHSIPVLQPEKLKSPDFLGQLRKLQPDLMIVVAFRMLPEAVWALPPMGTFNLHGSLLPQYRGAAPINRAVMNGETMTGVTTFLLKQEIDTGNILFRQEIPIGAKETAGELHDRMMVIGADLVVKTIDALATGSVTPAPQSEFVKPGEVLRDAPKIFKEDCAINWNDSCEKIFNHVRGLSPYPTAWSNLHNGDETPVPLKIYACSYHYGEENRPRGSVNDRMDVAAPDGCVVIEEIQAPGKKRMDVADFLRGFKILPNARFE